MAGGEVVPLTSMPLWPPAAASSLASPSAFHQPERPGTSDSTTGATLPASMAGLPGSRGRVGGSGLP